MKKNHKKNRQVKKFIRLFFNGDLAEPQYFEGFNLLKSSSLLLKLHTKKSKSSESPWQLIDRAIKEKDNLDSEDEVWCIFDVDDYWKENSKKFNAALVNAKNKGINICWNNECFEIWFLLHFEYCSNSIPRTQYHQKLKKHFKKIGFNYKKNCNVFDALNHLQNNAINHATNLFKTNSKVESNPSTSIFKLISKINSML